MDDEARRVIEAWDSGSTETLADAISRLRRAIEPDPPLHLPWLNDETMEIVGGGDLTVGSHILLECEVYRHHKPSAQYAGHLYFRPDRNSLINSDGKLWTWANTQQGTQKIVRLKPEFHGTYPPPGK